MQLAVKLPATLGQQQHLQLVVVARADLAETSKSDHFEQQGPRLRPHVRAWRARLTNVVVWRLHPSFVLTCPHQSLTPLRASLAPAGAVAQAFILD